MELVVTIRYFLLTSSLEPLSNLGTNRHNYWLKEFNFEEMKDQALPKGEKHVIAKVH